MSICRHARNHRSWGVNGNLICILVFCSVWAPLHALCAPTNGWHFYRGSEIRKVCARKFHVLLFEYIDLFLIVLPVLMKLSVFTIHWSNHSTLYFESKTSRENTTHILWSLTLLGWYFTLAIIHNARQISASVLSVRFVSCLTIILLTGTHGLLDLGHVTRMNINLLLAGIPAFEMSVYQLLKPYIKTMFLAWIFSMV